MNVYLDNCVIVDIEKGARDILEIAESNSLGQPTYLYSLAHLFEAKQISNLSDGRALERCGLLHRITQSNFISYSTTEQSCHIVSLAPIMMYDLISDVHWQQIASSFEMLEPLKAEIKKFRPLNTKVINNMPPEQLLYTIDGFLKSSMNKTLKGIIAEHIVAHPSSSYFNVKQVSEHIVLFFVIDLFGFYRDRNRRLRNTVWDGLHSYFAAFSDVLVSSDKSFCMKSEVVFSYYNVNTKVVFLD